MPHLRERGQVSRYGGGAVGRRLSGVSLALVLICAPVSVAAAEAPAALVKAFKERSLELQPQGIKGGVHKVIMAREGFLLLRDELRFAATDRFWGIAALGLKPDVPIERVDPVTAIATFSEDLAKHGIELLFAPSPTRPIVMPEAVLGKGAIADGEATPRLQPVEAEFYAALRARGVNVVDITKVFLEHRRWERGPLYVPSDPHWTGAGIVLAAGEIAAWIEERPWYAAVPKLKLTAEWKTVDHYGPLYQDLERAGLEKRPPNRVQCRPVRAIGADGTPARIEPRNPESPVILIGDSHTNWWRSQDSTLYQQLAYELGFTVDNLATVGGGTNESRLNLVRTARATPGYLAGKKLVIWCFGSRDTLGHRDGWVRTPLAAGETAR